VLISKKVLFTRNIAQFYEEDNTRKRFAKTCEMLFNHKQVFNLWMSKQTHDNFALVIKKLVVDKQP
jgi:hypothetical protein